MKIFGREPALWVAGIAAILGLIASFGVPWLTDTQTTVIVALVDAAGGVIIAVRTRPIAPGAFLAFVGAVVAVLAAYGVAVSQHTVGAVDLVLLAALALITRGQVSPVSPAAEKARAHAVDLRRTTEREADDNAARGRRDLGR